MSNPKLIAHDHQPLFRVIRTQWIDPLDASFSQNAGDNRWNDPSFPALYLCCSERVAEAVALDILKYGEIDPRDLQPEYLPQLAHISWTGDVVDMISEDGIAAVALPAEYPEKVDKKLTRALAQEWVRDKREGVVCRSASMHRKGFSNWVGAHQTWGELALFVNNIKTAFKQLARKNLPLHGLTVSSRPRP